MSEYILYHTHCENIQHLYNVFINLYVSFPNYATDIFKNDPKYRSES